MSQIWGQSIQDFYRVAQQRGFARDFQFKITGFTVNGISLLPDDLVFLKTASLPSKTLNTITASFMGLDFQIPGTISYEGNKSWPVKFYCTQDYGLRQFLEASMQGTFDENTSTGNIEPRSLRDNSINLSLMDDQMNEIMVYTLLGAFVTKIDDINYDTTKSGAVQEVGASIAYQYWVSEIGDGTATGFPGLEIDLNIIPGVQINLSI